VAQEKGQKGERGEVGITGNAATIQGDIGAMGPRGSNGVFGPKGPLGPAGLFYNNEGGQGSGPQGDKGVKGSKGSIGPIGPSGFKGSQGSQGSKGTVSLDEKGNKGNEGSQGANGEVPLVPAENITFIEDTANNAGILTDQYIATMARIVIEKSIANALNVITVNGIILNSKKEESIEKAALFAIADQSNFSTFVQASSSRFIERSLSQIIDVEVGDSLSSAKIISEGVRAKSSESTLNYAAVNMNKLAVIIEKSLSMETNNQSGKSLHAEAILIETLSTAYNLQMIKSSSVAPLLPSVSSAARILETTNSAMVSTVVNNIITIEKSLSEKFSEELVRSSVMESAIDRFLQEDKTKGLETEAGLKSELFSANSIAKSIEETLSGGLKNLSTISALEGKSLSDKLQTEISREINRLADLSSMLFNEKERGLNSESTIAVSIAQEATERSKSLANLVSLTSTASLNTIDRELFMKSTLSKSIEDATIALQLSNSELQQDIKIFNGNKDSSQRSFNDLKKTTMEVETSFSTSFASEKSTVINREKVTRDAMNGYVSASLSHHKTQLQDIKDEMSSARYTEDSLKNELSMEISSAVATESNIDISITEDSSRAFLVHGKLDTDLTSEETRAKDSEQKIGSEQTKLAQSKESSLLGNFQSENERQSIQTRTIDESMQAEKTRGSFADSTLNLDIQSEIKEAVASRTVIETEILDAQTTAENQLSNSQLTLKNEIIRATAAELVLKNDIQSVIDTSRTEESTISVLSTSFQAHHIGQEVSLSTSLEIVNSNAIGSEMKLTHELSSAISRSKSFYDVSNIEDIPAVVRRAKETEATLYYTISQQIQTDNILFKGLYSVAMKETTDAIAEESKVQSEINVEKARASNADNLYQSAYGSYSQAAVEAEKNILGRIEAQVSKAKDTEKGIITNLQKRSSNAKSSEADISTSLFNEEGRARGAEDVLQKSFSVAMTMHMSAENTMKGDLTIEISRATTAENNLDEIVATEINRAKGQEDAASKALKVLEDAGDIYSDLKNTLSVGTANADTAEKLLGSDVNDEKTMASQAESYLRTTFDASSSARVSNEQNLLQELNDLSIAAETKHNTVATDSSNEIKRAKGEENKLSESLVVESNLAISTESTIMLSFTNENVRSKEEVNQRLYYLFATLVLDESTRAKANAVAIKSDEDYFLNLQQDTKDSIDTQILLAKGTESTLKSQLDAETNRRSQWDTSMADSISVASSLEVNRFDSENTGFFALLGMEVKREEAAILVIKEKTDDENSRAKSIEISLDSQLTTATQAALKEEMVLLRSVDSEKVRAMDSRAEIRIDLNRINVDASDANLDLQEKISLITKSATSAEDVLRNRLGQEISRASSAENAVLGFINSEDDRSKDERAKISQQLSSEIENTMQSATSIKGSLSVQIKNAMDRESLLSKTYQAELDATETYVKNQGQDLTNEVNLAESGEKGLQTKLNTENSNAVSSEKSLKDNIDADISAAKSAELVLAKAIDTQSKLAYKNEQNLVANLGNEKSRANAAEDDLLIALSNRITNQKSTETSDSDIIESEKTRASTAEDAIYEQLVTESAQSITHMNQIKSDTEEEVKKAMAFEASISTVLTSVEVDSQIARDTVSSDLSVEVSRAMIKEASLAAKEQTESDRALGLEESLSTALQEEISMTFASESNLANAIILQTNTASTAEQIIFTALQNEISVANAKEKSLLLLYDSVLSRARVSEKSISNYISSEEKQAVATDRLLEGRLSSQVALASNIEVSIEAKLSSRSKLAREVENSLSAALLSVISRTMLTEKSLVSSIDSSSSTAITATSTQLNNEIVRATASDLKLANALGNEISRANDKRGKNSAFVGSEVDRASNAEAILFSKFDALKVSVSSSEAVMAAIQSSTRSSTEKSKELIIRLKTSTAVNEVEVDNRIKQEQERTIAEHSWFKNAINERQSTSVDHVVTITTDISALKSHLQHSLEQPHSSSIGFENSRATNSEIEIQKLINMEIYRKEPEISNHERLIIFEKSRAMATEGILSKGLGALGISVTSQQALTKDILDMAEIKLLGDESDIKLTIEKFVLLQALQAFSADEKIDDEKRRAKLVETSLNSNLNVLFKSIGQSEITVQSIISQETRRAESSENSLNTKIKQQSIAAKGTERDISLKLLTAVAASSAFEKSRLADINFESTRANVVENSIAQRSDSDLKLSQEWQKSIAESLSSTSMSDSDRQLQLSMGITSIFDQALKREGHIVADMSSAFSRARDGELVVSNELSNMKSNQLQLENSLSESISVHIMSANFMKQELSAHLFSEISNSKEEELKLQGITESESTRAKNVDDQLLLKMQQEISNSKSFFTDSSSFLSSQRSSSKNNEIFFANFAKTESSRALTVENSMQVAITSRAGVILTDQFNLKSRLQDVTSAAMFAETVTGNILALQIDKLLNVVEPSITSNINVATTNARIQEDSMADVLFRTSARSINIEVSINTNLVLQKGSAVSAEQIISSAVERKFIDIASSAEENLKALNFEISIRRVAELQLVDYFKSSEESSAIEEAQARFDFKTIRDNHQGKESEFSLQFKNEVNRATTQETSLSQLISEESTRFQIFDSSTSIAISSQISSSIFQENNFGNGQNIDISTAISKEDAVSTGLFNEISRSLGFDQSFTDNFSVSKVHATVTETSIGIQISILQSFHVKTETSLNDALIAESNREGLAFDVLFSIVSAVPGSISEETNRATLVEDSLAILLEDATSHAKQNDLAITGTLPLILKEFNVTEHASMANLSSQLEHNQISSIITEKNISIYVSSTVTHSQEIELLTSQLLNNLSSGSKNSEQKISDALSREYIRSSNNLSAQSHSIQNLILLTKLANENISLALNLEQSRSRTNELSINTTANIQISSAVFSETTLANDTKAENSRASKNEMSVNASLLIEINSASAAKELIVAKLSLTVQKLGLRADDTHNLINEEVNRATFVESSLINTVELLSSTVQTAHNELSTSFVGGEKLHLNNELILKNIASSMNKKVADTNNTLSSNLYSTKSRAASIENDISAILTTDLKQQSAWNAEFQTNLSFKINNISMDKQLLDALQSETSRMEQKNQTLQGFVQLASLTTKALVTKFNPFFDQFNSSQKNRTLLLANIVAETSRAMKVEVEAFNQSSLVATNLSTDLVSENGTSLIFQSKLLLSLAASKSLLDAVIVQEARQAVVVEANISSVLSSSHNVSYFLELAEKNRASAQEYFLGNIFSSNSSALATNLTTFAFIMKQNNDNLSQAFKNVNNSINLSLENIELMAINEVQSTVDVLTVSYPTIKLVEPLITIESKICNNDLIGASLFYKIMVLMRQPLKFQLINNGSNPGINGNLSRLDFKVDNSSCINATVMYHGTARRRGVSVQNVLGLIKNAIDSNIVFEYSIYVPDFEDSITGKSTSTSGDQSKDKYYALLAITFLLHVVWFIGVCLRFYQNNHSQEKFIKTERDLQKAISEAKALFVYDKGVQAEASLVARRKAAELRLQSLLEQQAENDRKVRDNLISRDQQRLAKRSSRVSLKDEDYTVWVVNSAADKWSMENNATAFNYDQDIRYNDIASNRSNIKQSPKKKQMVFQYEQHASPALQHNVIEEVNLIQPLKYQVHDYNDSSAFFEHVFSD